jgi:ribosomal protein S18 acetylase RimI-like enzyme
VSAEWTIRPAGPDDADALALIGGASFLESFAGMIDGQALVAHCARQHAAETYRAYFAKGARAWIAGLAPGGAPVGYALLSPPELDQAREGDIELKRIYVLSRFQGSGVAAALMDAALTAAEGSRRLLLGVKADNHRALAFYRKQGFAVIGDRQFDVGGTRYDDLVLARAFTPADMESQ